MDTPLPKLAAVLASIPPPTTVNVNVNVGVLNNNTNNFAPPPAPESARPRRAAAAEGEQRRREAEQEERKEERSGKAEAVESESEASEGEGESESEEEEVQPKPKKKKKETRRRDKNGQLMRTPAQIQAKMKGCTDRAQAAYEAQKRTPAYDIKVNLVRNMVRKIGEPSAIKFSIDRQIAELLPRIKSERITYAKAGYLHLEGGGNKINYINYMVKAKMWEQMNDESKALAAKIKLTMSELMCEHATPNTPNYSRANVYAAVVGFTNKKFQENSRAVITSDFPGVSWHTDKKKWRAQASLTPGSKQKTLGRFADEFEAARKFIDAMDKALAPAKYAKYRAALIFYDEDGTLRPHLKVFAKFSDLARFLRPAIYARLPPVAANLFSAAKRGRKRARRGK